MKKIKIFTIVLLLIAMSFDSQAQIYGNSRLSIGEGLFMGSQGFEYNITLGEKAKFHITPGARINILGISSGTRFLTAPAKLTGDDKNMDTLIMGDNLLASANLYIKLSYDINKWFYAGFDIDVVGFSFGPKGENLGFLGGENARNAGITSGIISSASPTSGNALLVGDRDLGTLNSTFFIGFQAFSNLAVEAGFNFLFTEYTTDRKIGPNNNDRFRNKAGLITLGASYRLTGKK
jgi:hypothetical protein